MIVCACALYMRVSWEGVDGEEDGEGDDHRS